MIITIGVIIITILVIIVCYHHHHYHCYYYYYCYYFSKDNSISKRVSIYIVLDGCFWIIYYS